MPFSGDMAGMAMCRDTETSPQILLQEIMSILPWDWIFLFEQRWYI